MQDPLRYTLISDGPSDWSLRPVLDWLLKRHSKQVFDGTWADLRSRLHPPRTLHERILTSIEDYPCELLFVHRDAEAASRDERVEEIQDALAEAKAEPPAVCVVPVKMSEAWLLIDEEAIRSAAGNPNGSVELPMPRLSDIERLPDPKKLLFGLLRQASERSARRRKLNVERLRYRVAERVVDYSPLQKLKAFKALEEELKNVLEERGW